MQNKNDVLQLRIASNQDKHLSFHFANRLSSVLYQMFVSLTTERLNSNKSSILP